MPTTFTVATLDDWTKIALELHRLQFDPAAEPPGPIVIDLDGSALRGATVSVGDEDATRPLDVEIRGHGTALTGGSALRVAGDHVTVRDLRITATAEPGVWLTAKAVHAITLDHVAVIGARSAGTGSGARSPSVAIKLVALGAGVSVSATRCAVLDATVTPAVSLTANGSSSFGDVAWADGRFGGNATPEIALGGAAHFSARGTTRMGTGEFATSDGPRTLIDDDWTEVPTDAAVLAGWRVAP